MTVTQTDVLDALATIPEPCSIAMDAPESLVSMGLVESIAVEGSHVEISLVLTDPSCVHFTSMRRFITDTLCARDDVDSVFVRMSTTQLWTPDRMNPAGLPGVQQPVTDGRGLLPLV